jgi:MFS superfamily sulfate permease-like transporter
MALSGGHPAVHRNIEQATIGLALPSAAEWWTGLTRGAIPQLPLTLLNSVIAVCALSADYFPGRGVSPKRMAASVGVMNLLCVPLGGMPMCHGAGGLASQHAFGARTGGSVVMLGLLKIAAGLLLGTTLAAAVASYPASILAVMVIVAGLVLARAARDALASWNSLAVMVATAGGILALGTLYGFIVGVACAGLCSLLARRSAA